MISSILSLSSSRSWPLQRWRKDEPRGRAPSGDQASPATWRLFRSFERRAWRLMILGLALVVCVAAIVYLMQWPSTSSPSRLEKIPNMDTTPGGIHQRESERYRETLRSSNVSLANEAEEVGSSFVSVPEALPEMTAYRSNASLSNDSEAHLTPRQAAEQIAVATSSVAMRAETMTGMTVQPETLPARETSASESLKSENSYSAAMLHQMNMMAQTLEIAGLRSVELTSHHSNEEGVSDAPKGEAMKSQATHVFASGTILTGETITLIDSDVPTPVTVRMTSHPIVGGVLMGRFTPNEWAKGIMMDFNRLILPSGQEIAIQAMAIDPFTRGGAVRAHVNTRPIQRYGPMLVSSFLAGFADHATRPVVTFADTNQGVSVTSDRPNMRDNLIAGIGQGANVMSSNLLESAPKSSQIRLYPGEQVRILLLSSAQIPIDQME